MKLLWANSSFLHPTTRGGQIRTLEMLRRLHRRHEIHYAALWDPQEAEGVEKAPQYCTRAVPFRFQAASKRSPRFALEVAAGVFEKLPLAIGRWRCVEMRETLARLIRDESYDAMVCDFLVTAVNFPDLERAALFQHNVESVIWERHAENARDGMRRRYFQMQAQRMFAFEKDACRRSAHVIAVSEKDAQTIERRFDARCSSIPTGVDTEYFRPQHPGLERRGLVFVGSMDWMPNIDGVRWFAEEVLPAIRARAKDMPITIVGRNPPAAIVGMADTDPHLRVTGTVPDVRPYLWEAAVSIVPLRIGGGTRLKIYESMAAGAAVVSTTIGAEGLDIGDGETIALADDPAEFARRSVDLGTDAAARERMAAAAQDMVAARYSWERVSKEFEEALMRAPTPAAK